MRGPSSKPTYSLDFARLLVATLPRSRRESS